jgi:hypothetical protein
MLQQQEQIEAERYRRGQNQNQPVEGAKRRERKRSSKGSDVKFSKIYLIYSTLLSISFFKCQIL